MGVFALSVNVKTHIEIIPITAAATFEAVDILNTVEGLNSSWRGTLSRFRNLTSDIFLAFAARLRTQLCGAGLKALATITGSDTARRGCTVECMAPRAGGLHATTTHGLTASTRGNFIDYSSTVGGGTGYRAPVRC